MQIPRHRCVILEASCFWFHLPVQALFIPAVLANIQLVVDNCGSSTACTWVTCSIPGVPISIAMTDGHPERVKDFDCTLCISVSMKRVVYIMRRVILSCSTQDMLDNLKVIVKNTCVAILHSDICKRCQPACGQVDGRAPEPSACILLDVLLVLSMYLQTPLL